MKRNGLFGWLEDDDGSDTLSGPHLGKHDASDVMSTMMITSLPFSDLPQKCVLKVLAMLSRH